MPPAAADALLQDVLTTPPAGDAPAPSGATHIFGAKCINGHITYFDKREVCRHQSDIMRSTVLRDGKRLDALRLRCGTPGCGAWMVVEEDCEGYR